DEVDPEFRSLGHRAPDDRERDTREDDLEEVRACAGDRCEEAIRSLPDRKHRVRRGREAMRADDAVAVAECDPEADEPVDERADPEDENVLAGDGRGVLHPRQARLEEGEAGLHEHDQHCRDDDPDRVGRDQEIRIAHRASTVSSARPVRVWMTFSTWLVQTRPSPDSLPLRAESAIASTTVGAISSSTTNVSSALGRKRDSN